MYSMKNLKTTKEYLTKNGWNFVTSKKPYIIDNIYLNERISILSNSFTLKCVFYNLIYVAKGYKSVPLYSKNMLVFLNKIKVVTPNSIF